MADKIVVAWKIMDKAGVEEDLYSTFKNLSGVTGRVWINFKKPVSCSDIWPMYMQMRIQGTSAEKTLDAIDKIAHMLSPVAAR